MVHLQIYEAWNANRMFQQKHEKNSEREMENEN